LEKGTWRQIASRRFLNRACCLACFHSASVTK
jgi:hypothetical protein